MHSSSLLVLNSGSSSLKFELFENDAGMKSLIRGKISDIGGNSSLDWSNSRTQANVFIKVHDHEDAAIWILDWLQYLWPFGSLLSNLTVVAHRIVHGGNDFFTPLVVTEKTIADLQSLSSVAPLHNPKALAVIRTSQKNLPDNVVNVAVFDTAFFHNLPPHTGYALPKEIVKEHGIHRLGFHGFAHASMKLRYQELAGRQSFHHRIISFQLGHGCSVAAIRNGKPVDTSMGFTPLEGLMMAARSGDIDPGILMYLLGHGYTREKLEEVLQSRSGLLGVAGSGDSISQLLARQDTDKHARLAVDMFCHRARKYLGAYLAVMNGADTVLFGGGIGENVPEIRKRICQDMQWCGLQIDEERNRAVVGEGVISADGSGLGVYVISVNEEILIGKAARVATKKSSRESIYLVSKDRSIS